MFYGLDKDTLDKMNNDGHRIVAVDVNEEHLSVSARVMEQISNITGGGYIPYSNANDLKDAFLDLQSIYI